MQDYGYKGVKDIFLSLPESINRENRKEKKQIRILAVQMRLPDAKICLAQSCSGNLP